MRKRFLVTGGSRGLGGNITASLNTQHDVVISTRQPQQPQPNSVYLDFFKEPNVFRESLKSLTQPFDFFVHNAAPYSESPFAQTSEQDIIDFGYFAINTALLTKAVALAPSGKIIFVGSCAADHLYPIERGGAIYIMYKTWLQSFARELMREGKSLVVLINPGAISEEKECPNDAVASADVVAKINEACFTSQFDNQVIELYPQNVRDLLAKSNL
jgi:NAD(P)-dependent dehydrogenase (short-subunit alcohol dehydrogenase family)